MYNIQVAAYSIEGFIQSKTFSLRLSSNPGDSNRRKKLVGVAMLAVLDRVSSLHILFILQATFRSVTPPSAPITVGILS